MPINGAKKIVGGGPQWLNAITTGIRDLSNETERSGIIEFLREEAGVSLSTSEVAETMSFTDKDLFNLATTPLAEIENKNISILSRSDRGLTNISAKLPFDIQKHEAAQSHVASAFWNRLVNDMKEYSNMKQY